MMKFTSTPHPESGNVLFYILIAVALLAALSMAVSQSGRTTTAGVSEDKARILISDITDYGRQVSEAISALRLNGCLLEQISFENPKTTGYVNSSAPADKSCHIFSTKGGNLNWPNFSPESFDETYSSQTDYGHPIFTIKNQVPEMGTDGTSSQNYDLMMLVKHLETPLCRQMNERAHNTTAIPVANEQQGKYVGIINTTDVFTFPSTFKGRRQSCFEDTGGADAESNSYYYILSIR